MQLPFRFFLSTCLCLLMMTCTKTEIQTVEVEVEVPRIPHWKEDKRFTDINKIRTNSLATTEYLFLNGPSYFTRIGTDGSIDISATRLAYPEYFRLPIHKDYFVEAEGDFLRLASTLYPVRENYDSWLHFPSIEPNFKDINIGFSYERPTIAINDQGQCLVPINQDQVFDSLFLYLLDVAISPEQRVQISDTTRISIAVDRSTIYQVEGFGDYFLVAGADEVIKIYSDGTYRKVLDTSVFRFFKMQDKVYALKQFEDLYESADAGESWVAKTGYPLVLSNHQILEDTLITYRLDQLQTLQLQSDQFVVRPLKNEGLETTRINSLAVFNDSVYVATLSGVFKTSLTEFYESP